MLHFRCLIPFSRSFTTLVLLASLLLLSSCMPEGAAPRVASNNSTGAQPDPNSNAYNDPIFPLSGTFVQEGVVKTSTQFILPVNFSDSFLIRGKEVSTQLRKLPNTTKFCVVGKFTYVTSEDRFLIMTAKPRQFTDLVNKTTEFYLQVEPGNDQANQNDCLSFNLSNSLLANATSPSFYFGLTQICSNCTTSVISTPLKLFYINGEEVPSVSMGGISMNISGSTANSSNFCAESTLCKSRGFDCCLDSQCVKDGAVKPGINLLDPSFLSALEDVKLNPGRFLVYPQYYFVCHTRPENSGGTTPTPTVDPNYAAAIRLIEYNQLYQCLNQIDGEFSYCTVKFTEASKKIPGYFSASDNGFHDDINFTSLNANYVGNAYANNIVKVIYGGKTLYELNKTAVTGMSFNPGTLNDDLAQSQVIHVTTNLPSNAQDDNLYISYKIDGTCEKIGSSTARCSKTYNQASSNSDIYKTTYHDGTKTYYLPIYADLSGSGNVIVKINDVVVPEDSSTWSKVPRNPAAATADGRTNKIVFNPAYSIFQNQKIFISYFVNTDSNLLVQMKTTAQAQVNSMCTCASSAKCNLRPLYDASNKLINFECTYPTPTSTEPPANQTVFVSNKNVPHRYFDQEGVNYDENYGDAPAQELTAFGYTNNDILRPNNVSQYIGFNEIYGSFSKSGTYLARPAKLVKVKKDKMYDIITTSGVFSTCLTCGSDYYTSLQKIFPQNFSAKAGGYKPDHYESRREGNGSLYRADDLLFGRACFVPATMIPWTHKTGATATEQRQARLSAQHFLFANGYSRDWYGFDYGSLIGSFDGVSWFSVGNQRRIKAKGNKLYLAVNAYMGDLSVDNSFNVMVSETTTFNSAIPEHDTDSDGAECQRSHFCSTDNDCFRTLGYEYSCQNIAGMTTEWPQFDPNAQENVGSSTKTLSSIVGGTNGRPKRCVYRGRGAPCLNDLTQVNGNTFNGSSLVGTLTCSSNNSCLSLSSNKFNDRVARFANTPTTQNLAEVYTPLSDTVGLGARIIGRPFDYYGGKTVASGVSNTLLQNNVQSVCVPGKDVANSTWNFDLNARSPANRADSSDKLFGVGTTMSGSISSKYLSACPATDYTGTGLHLMDRLLTDSELTKFTITQNMSSNLLDLSPLRTLNIYSSNNQAPIPTNGSQVASIGYQRNTCLRAPGATCFSDMECAPSNFIAGKANNANLTSLLNEAEIKFWREEMTCGNPEFKYVQSGVLNPNFNVANNTCCREIGKTLSVYTETADATSPTWCDAATKKVVVAGINVSIASSTRYSRVHTGYDKMTCDRAEMTTSTPFALSVKAPDSGSRFEQILGQYKTLDNINQRTCCSKHWVRSFASTNGGGHAFAKAKMQTINKGMFKHVSWFPQDTTLYTDAPFNCGIDQYANSSCEVRSFTPSEEEKYLTWAGTLELIGIPQVAVMTNDQVYKIVDNSQLKNFTDNNPMTYLPLDDSIKNVNDPTVGGEDFLDSGTGHKYYSAASYTKFVTGTGKIRKIFSENEFNCCVPTGQEVPSTVGPTQCCTGYVANLNGPRRCCLPDFTNVSVYLNRYVSSEGRGLPENAYDSKTGFIKDPGQVQLMANVKNLCCSGKAMTGVAISNLSIPIEIDKFLPFSPLTTSRRFNYRTDAVDNNAESGSIGSTFDAGLRWNNHVYCVPEGFGGN